MNPDPASLAHLRHELRTPLNHVLGYSEMLLEDASEASELAAELRQVRGEGRMLLAAVEDSLSPVRVEEGGPDLGHLASVLSAPLDRLGESVGRLRRLATESGAGPVVADAERISAAVSRLRTLVVGWGAGSERGTEPTPAPRPPTSATKFLTDSPRRSSGADMADAKRSRSTLALSMRVAASDSSTTASTARPSLRTC